MKLLFYIGSLEYGGAERVMSNLANEMAKRGHEVVFLTAYKKEKEYTLASSIKRLSIEPYGNAIMKQIRHIVRLSEICKAEKADIAISFMAEPNLRLLSVNLFRKQKVIISIRNDPKKEYPGKLLRLAKLLFRRANGCVFQTEDAQSVFTQSSLKSKKIILNPVREDFYVPSSKDERKDVYTVGRLEPQKNHQMLIKAFSLIANEVKDNLIIVGEGSMRPVLEKMIHDLCLEKRVQLYGSTNQVAQVIKHAKAFVLSSDYEGLPNCLMEAMALGIPVISTDCPCGGPKSLIENNTYGELVPVGDEQTMADAMMKLINDSKKVRELSEQSRKRAALFHTNVIFDQWETFFQSVRRK